MKGKASRANAYWGFIKDPLYGYIRLTDTERRLIDTEPVQRLRRIRQLTGAEYVYPAANHTRFEHSLGTMYLAGILAENLPASLSKDDVEQLKISALLRPKSGLKSWLLDNFAITSSGMFHQCHLAFW